MACWVELTKMYYICVRESRNLTLRGVVGIESPTFRLPDTSKSIPPPFPSDDGFTFRKRIAEVGLSRGSSKVDRGSGREGGLVGGRVTIQSAATSTVEYGRVR